MNDTEKNNIRQKLVQEQQELREMLGRFANKDEHVVDDFHSKFPDYGGDEEENAEEVGDFQDELSIEQNLERALRDVDAALAALDKGTYGVCRVCGKPIEAARLQAMSAATTCLEHKSSPL